MKEYEISNNDKVLGKINIFNDNIKNDLSNSLIESRDGLIYESIKLNEYQTYEIEYIVNNIDDLFDIVSKYKYDNDEVFNSIEEIKKYNDIKIIKKATKIKIVVPEIYLKKLGISKNNIDINSLFLSKIYFVKQTLSNLSSNEIVESLNMIINDYNGFINSGEYEFLTDEEKKENINLYLKRIDDIIFKIENISKFKYGKDYIIPIKISNN